MAAELAPARPAGGRLGGLRRALLARYDLTLAFVRREVGIRYKEAYAGVAWAVLQPLAFMLLLTLLFSRIAHVPGATALGAYVALVPWLFVSTSLLQGSQSILNQLGVVSKIYFPREVLPVAAIAAAGLDAAIAFGLELVLLVATGEGLAATLLLWPLLMALTGALCLGVTLILAPAVVRFRDLRYVLPVCVQLLFLASPVGYPLEAVPEGARRWYELNPLAGLMDAFRGIALDGEVPGARQLLPAALWAAVLLALGALYFRRQESTVADYV